MRVGIVGGAGFLGGNLYDAIIRGGVHSPHIFDLQPPPGADPDRFTPLDVTEPGTIRGAFDGFQVVFYKTGLMGPAASFESPLDFYRLNLEGALRVLEECLRNGVEQFVYDSTECVFGHANRAPFSETERPRPGSIYGATKASCENYLRHIAATENIETAILRYPRVISPANSNVFTAIKTMISKNAEIRLTAGGEKKFDIVHLDDVVQLNRWFLENRRSCTLHVTAGFALTVKDVIGGLSERLLGRADYGPVIASDELSLNDRLLPDPMILDDRISREATGLDVRMTRLEQFLDLFV
jgi:UDP-glucose 4-epimerase